MEMISMGFFMVLYGQVRRSQAETDQKNKFDAIFKTHVYAYEIIEFEQQKHLRCNSLRGGQGTSIQKKK
ncbi:hypothetical protein CMV_007614 [Castanea mollissima]|uniref:Uncharacterized protein n=1 Tax=Castanea mollissima TaxID=60419 RepID=A0A8J4RII1_9ROSI|nr:hypothetical protein CMV_007614 [Castanea mollissima]